MPPVLHRCSVDGVIIHSLSAFVNTFFKKFFLTENTSAGRTRRQRTLFLLDIMILIIIYTGSGLQNDILLQYIKIYRYDILRLKYKIDANITLFCTYLMVIVQCFVFKVMNDLMLYCVVFWYVYLEGI